MPRMQAIHFSPQLASELVARMGGVMALGLAFDDHRRTSPDSEINSGFIFKDTHPLKRALDIYCDNVFFSPEPCFAAGLLS